MGRVTHKIDKFMRQDIDDAENLREHISPADKDFGRFYGRKIWQHQWDRYITEEPRTQKHEKKTKEEETCEKYIQFE